MSDLTDDIEDQYWRDEFESDDDESDNMLLAYKAKELTWTTKDDEDILVQDMSISHITACIAMLSKVNTTMNQVWIDIFTEELQHRGIV